MHVFPIAVVSTFLALLDGAAAQRPPGYEGTLPSECAQEALGELIGGTWEDKKGLLGGGTWQLLSGGVTPHALGPNRGDVMEMRSAVTKGPHLRIVRDHLAVSLPTASDGDVAATLRWLGQAVPAGIEGEPTANWRLAAARVEALGAAAAGLRAGLTVDPEHKHSIEVLVWQVDALAQAVSGTAQVKVDGTSLPLALVWPAKPNPAEGKSRIALKAGSTLLQQVELDALLAAAGKPKLAPGKHEVEFVLEGIDAAGAAFVLRSKKLELGEAASGKAAGREPAKK